MPEVCCIFFVVFLGWIWLMLTQVWLLLLQDPDHRPQLEEDHEQETSHLAALQTVAAEMSPVSWRAPIELLKVACEVGKGQETCRWALAMRARLQAWRTPTTWRRPAPPSSRCRRPPPPRVASQPQPPTTQTWPVYTGINIICKIWSMNLCFCPKRKKYKLEKGLGHKFDDFLFTSIRTLLSGHKLWKRK